MYRSTTSPVAIATHAGVPLIWIGTPPLRLSLCALRRGLQRRRAKVIIEDEDDVMPPALREALALNLLHAPPVASLEEVRRHDTCRGRHHV